MRVIPVIDLKGGIVVQGIGGRRAEYRPIVSQLTRSTQPADVARAFQDCLGCTELYLADLDAIAGSKPAFPIYEQIRSQRLNLWIDPGIRTQAQRRVFEPLGYDLVLGLETLASPRELSGSSPDRAVFSLDLKHGEPLGDRTAWGHWNPYAIAAHVHELGIRRVILLDLARVGMGEGLGTEALCRELRDDHPTLEIILGGGVRGMADVRVARDLGASGVLVASALHDGRITRIDR